MALKIEKKQENAFLICLITTYYVGAGQFRG